MSLDQNTGSLLYFPQPLFPTQVKALFQFLCEREQVYIQSSSVRTDQITPSQRGALSRHIQSSMRYRVYHPDSRIFLECACENDRRHGVQVFTRIRFSSAQDSNDNIVEKLREKVTVNIIRYFNPEWA